MERIPNSCTLASLVVLFIFISFPVRSWCEEELYKSPTQGEPACCVREDAEKKRFEGIDYDSFVSLMGRRSAPPPNCRRLTRWSRKRDAEDIFADLLGRKAGMAPPCTQAYLQTGRGQFDPGRQRL